VHLLCVFLVACGALRRLPALPPLVVLGYELGGGLGICESALALARVSLSGSVATARELRGARVLGAIDLFCRAPRCFARQITGRELTAMKPPSLGPCRGFERAFELALASLGALRFVASRFDVTQRLRQRANLLVDGFFSDSPERVERVFSRHDA